MACTLRTQIPAEHLHHYRSYVISHGYHCEVFVSPAQPDNLYVLFVDRQQAQCYRRHQAEQQYLRQITGGFASTS